jgi:hypothetical protein
MSQKYVQQFLSPRHVGPCIYSMVCRQVADRGNGFQLRRVDVNILNKEWHTADKEWSYSLGVGHGANNPSPQKIKLTKCSKEPRTWTDSLDKQPK